MWIQFFELFFKCSSIAVKWYFFGDFLSPCKILQYDHEWNVVFGLEVTANLASLTPNEVAKMGFTRGSLMRGLVGSPPSRNVERGQKSGKTSWPNGDQKWPPEAFMGTLLQVKSSENHTHSVVQNVIGMYQKFQILVGKIPFWIFPPKYNLTFLGFQSAFFVTFLHLGQISFHFIVCPSIFEGFFEKGANFSHLHFDCTFQVQNFFRSENHEFLTKTKSWFLSTFFLSYFVHLHICDSHLPTPAP